MQEAQILASRKQVRSRQPIPVPRDPLIPDVDESFLQNLQATISGAQKNFFVNMQDQHQWNYFCHMGLQFTSQFYLLQCWLDYPSRLDKEAYREQVIKAQNPDGSWEQMPDPSCRAGDLSTTILNYTVLKSFGEALDTNVMGRARTYILVNGGLEKATVFTKILLALFRNLSWSELPVIPYAVFLEANPLNYRSFGQWVIPHLMPITYIRKMRLSRDAGPEFCLQELRTTLRPKILSQKSPSPITDGWLINKIISKQNAVLGSWGGYTAATSLAIISLEHYRLHHAKRSAEFQPLIDIAHKFIEDRNCDNHPAQYNGQVCDGHYWDTILAGLALAESGVSRDLLLPTAKYILDTQQDNGAIPFGFDFEDYPDVDDTSEAILFLKEIKHDEKAQRRMLHWVMSMQNDDGGWGAFDRNNSGNAIIDYFARDFKDSVDLTDDSSADLTGHVLEAMGAMGRTSKNCEVVARAIAYIKREQTTFGAWEARWGVNYIFGVSTVVVGLLSVGEDLQSDYIQKSLRWLISCQNEDGGFGETVRSYKNPMFAGFGYSTPTQTSWALQALIAAGMSDFQFVRDGIDYLMKNFHGDEGWVDEAVTGTGHPGLLYLSYPVYAHAFSLITLSRYSKAIGVRP